MTSTIALIGLGGIAADVLRALRDDTAVRVAQVLVRPERRRDAQREVPPEVQVIDSLAGLSDEVTLVVETAGHGAVAEHGAEVLRLGRDFGVISSGALADDALRDRLVAQARRAGRRLLVFNGAVGALDAVASARAAGLTALRYSGIKPARAWAGTPAQDAFDLDALTEPTVVFEGSAREVALTYPRNANVAATLALAGAGMDETQVRLIADPAATTNRHIVEGTSSLGGFRFETEALPSPTNPKTSASTAFGIVACLRGGPNALRLA